MYVCRYIVVCFVPMSTIGVYKYIIERKKKESLKVQPSYFCPLCVFVLSCGYLKIVKCIYTKKADFITRYQKFQVRFLLRLLLFFDFKDI